MPDKVSPVDRKRQIERVMELLMQHWLSHPELRLGQLIDNTSGYIGFEDVFYLPDAKLLSFLERRQTK